VVLGPLELVFYGDNFDHEAGSLQVLADGSDVPRPLPFQVQQRKDAEFGGLANAARPSQIIIFLAPSTVGGR
jgi:hypothetical protein